MSYVSYAVAPGRPLGPPSLGELVSIKKVDTGLTPEQATYAASQGLQALWDKTASYRSGMTEEQAAAWFQCYRLSINPAKCRAQILGPSAPLTASTTGGHTGLLIGAAVAGVGALYLWKRKH